MSHTLFLGNGKQIESCDSILRGRGPFPFLTSVEKSSTWRIGKVSMMPRCYKRKTDRATHSRVDLERAAEEVGKGRHIRAVAREMCVDRMTLTRFIDRQKNGEAQTGFAKLSSIRMVFTHSMEADLANHIKKLSFQFHGLSPLKCRQLAYEFGKLNDVQMPQNWCNDERAGKDWLTYFMRRHHLSCRLPEATSIGRQTAFNRHTVGEFYDNLASVTERFKFPPHMIYNLDETGITDVQKPKQVVTQKGKKPVSVTPKERREHITLICAVNAVGNVIPPLFIFPCVCYHDHFIRGSPTGSIGCSTKSGQTNQDVFVQFLKHIISHTNCSPSNRLLLILDNHESHVSQEAVNVANANGVVMMTLPPHTSHELQPLDKSVFGPLKTYYSTALNGWMISNPGKVATIYDVPEIVNTAFMSAMSRQNILSGFEATGIFPYNRERFTDADFESAEVTNRPDPEELVTPVDPNQEPATSVDPNPEPATSFDLNQEPASSSCPNLGEPPAPGTPLSVQSPSGSTSGDHSRGYRSPKSIIPLLKAAPRKVEQTRRTRVKTRILTDTSEKQELESEREGKEESKSLQENSCSCENS
ncbi:uncharacterized protein LOC134060440 [Sardina pilchardus]|uniref:uncharacterized protein LOC134060440 n=1 Tax=Sardina pilchardus TaxID=27697 RepID=UPI002E165CA0